MARITSKTNWTASDRPLAPDFNRIESNNEQAFDEIDAEQSARIAGDSALQSSINELEAKIVKIKTLQSPGYVVAANTPPFTKTLDITGAGFNPTAAWELLRSSISGEVFQSFTFLSMTFISDGVRLTFIESNSASSPATRTHRITVAGA